MRRSVQLVPLDRYNWETVLDIRLKPEQEAFVPAILYSLAQARFEQLFPFGIELEGRMVGFLMYGNFSGICWINRVMVDQEFQGLGIGTQAMKLLLQHLQSKPACQEIRTSFDLRNEAAQHFFLSLGFTLMPEALEHERVAVYEAP